MNAAAEELDYCNKAIRLALRNLGDKLNRGRVPTPADARTLKLLREVLATRVDEEAAHRLAVEMLRPLVERIKGICYGVVDALGLDPDAVARYRDALTEQLDALAGEEK